MTKPAWAAFAYDPDMREVPPEKQRVVGVFVVPWPEDLPDDIRTTVSGWEIRLHQMACGHAEGPYLIRKGGSGPSLRLICKACEKAKEKGTSK